MKLFYICSDLKTSYFEFIIYFIARGNRYTSRNSRMLSVLIRISLALLVINHILPPCTALRSYSSRNYNNKYDGKGYKDAEKPKSFTGSSSGIPSQNPTRRGLGISAWGIVTVILSIILAGMGFYYFSMCYPILCKKERKYDIIELTNV